MTNGSAAQNFHGFWLQNIRKEQRAQTAAMRNQVGNVAVPPGSASLGRSVSTPALSFPGGGDWCRALPPITTDMPRRAAPSSVSNAVPGAEGTVASAASVAEAGRLLASRRANPGAAPARSSYLPGGGVVAGRGSSRGPLPSASGSRRSTVSGASRLSSASSSALSRRNLLFFNDGLQKKGPPTARSLSSGMTGLTSVSQQSSCLRREVEQAVMEEVAKVVAPLHARLRTETDARQRAEELLNSRGGLSTGPTGRSQHSGQLENMQSTLTLPVC